MSSQYIPSSSEWLAWRDHIEQFYVVERRSLKEVIAIMESVYGFKAT